MCSCHRLPHRLPHLRFLPSILQISRLCAEEAAAQEQTGQVEECLKVNLLKLKQDACKKVFPHFFVSPSLWFEGRGRKVTPSSSVLCRAFAGGAEHAEGE